jgi:tetratricopeptide (TPR) repeat protein
VLAAAAGGASIALGVASEIIANLLGSELGGLVWLFVVTLVVGAVVIAVWETRRRRAQQASEVEGVPVVPPQPAGVPSTLPYPSGFIGRTKHVAWVVDSLRAEHAVAVVGRRGVGTSACAVQAANLVRDQFPAGQVYLDLRAGGRPLPARQVLAALARRLGTSPPRRLRPASLATAADALRARLDEQRILLVLDNVDHPAQVRALLPPAARSCRLLLAGGPALANMEGVAARWLAEPDPDDAVELFVAAGETAGTRRFDPRTDPAVQEIIELSARQPRAVRALGYRMVRHGWGSAEVLAALHRAVDAPPHQRLRNESAAGLLAERDVAYAALSPAASRLYRRMSLAPAPLDRPAIAAVSGMSPTLVDRLLEVLANGALIVAAPVDRYEIRPLLAPYARLHLRQAESARRRVAAQRRLVRHLVRRAERHAASLATAGTAAARTATLSFGDDPRGWFEVHQDLLHATVVAASTTDGAAGPLPRRVRRWWFRLAVALCGWYAQEDLLEKWAAICRAVLAAPTAYDQAEIAGWAHNELGVLQRRQGDPHGAAAALALAVAKRGRRGTAQARTNLGLALLDLGNVEDAIEHLELARRYRAHADRAGHAITDLALGAAYLARGEPAMANHHLIRAADAFHALGDQRGFAAALTNLPLAQWRLGEYLDAYESGMAALREYDAVTSLSGRAAALLNAGAVLVASKPARAEQAHQLLQEGRRLREQWRPVAGLGRTLLYLGDAAWLRDGPGEAVAHWTDAAGVCEAVGDGEGAAAADGRLSPADE